MQTFTLFEDFITLGQLLKEAGLIATGGAAKAFLAETAVSLNGEPENRRGKKLYAEDHLEIPSEGLDISFVAASAEEMASHAAEKAEKEKILHTVKEMNKQTKAVSSNQKPKSPFHK